MGGNRTGRFLEATVFGLDGRKDFIIIPEGRGGWGWQKFSGELRKAVDFLSATVGSGQGSSSSSTKKDAKVLGLGLGLKVDGAVLCGGVVLGSDLCCE